MAGVLPSLRPPPEHPTTAVPAAYPVGSREFRKFDGVLLSLALCAIPVSIAVTEILLVVSLLWRGSGLVGHPAKAFVPRVFWFWLAWAVPELIVWLRSPALRSGWGEIRHLLLIASLFLALPALSRTEDRAAVWR